MAPSAIRPEGQAFTEAGFVPFETPRALSADEMPRLIEDYRKAAENAKAAKEQGISSDDWVAFWEQYRTENAQ